MSFMKTLATLAVGFAAAKGLERYERAGGFAGLQAMMGGAGGPDGIAANLGSMAEKMGFPGGAQMVSNAMSQFAGLSSATHAATQAGLGGLFTALGGAAATGSGMTAEMMGALSHGTPLSAMAEANAKLMIRAMIQAAKADGQIDPDEQERILGHLKDADADEIAYVQQQLAAPLDVASLVGDTQAAMATQVYSSALMAITVHNEPERTFLARLAQGLGIDPATRDALHAAQGRAPLGV